MRMATIPAATPLLTRQLVRNLKDAGLDQMALSLDGPTAEIHDTFRGVPGAFDLTIQGAQFAKSESLPLQINTTFSQYNWKFVDDMIRLVGELGVVFWEVFFLVPMGRGKELGQMNAQQFEELFEKLASFAGKVDFIVKVTEAPHYRRYLLQQRQQFQRPDGDDDPQGGRPRRPGSAGQLPDHMTRDFGPGGSIGLAPKGVNSGNGHLFVSYCGDICPSGFLPLICGNVRTDSLAATYRSNEVFVQLRNADLFKGHCGICEYRHVCGGSRARAYAMTGDYLEDEPFCAYVPKSSRLARA
jgi:radical SAM protein with 4Fe4S-binding SPASM domain